MRFAYRVEKDDEAPWEGRRFGSFETAERYARGYVEAHINEKFVPRVEIHHDGILVAEVLASGDNRVWTDMKSEFYPVKQGTGT